MSLMMKYTEFETEFTATWKKHLDLHNQLNAYRGIDLKDKYEEVNILLKKIQDTMVILYPSINFIIQRSKMANDAVRDYNTFIETLKTVGATEYPEANA